MKALKQFALPLALGAVMLTVLGACGGGGGGGSGGGATLVTIGGTVSGLSGSGLEFRNNGADSLSIGANGAFKFTTLVSAGAAGTNQTVRGVSHGTS